MKRRTCFSAIVLAWLVTAGTYTASVQSQLMPAPDWAVWRAFHDSLEFYRRGSPSQVDSLFAARARLEPPEAEAVMTAGRAYLQELAAIEEVARAQIQHRLGSNGAPALPLASEPAPALASGFRPPERKAVSPDLVRENNAAASRLAALASEGFFARVEQQQEHALAAHRQRVAKAIGFDRLLALDEWIQAEVAPNVKTVRRPTFLDPSTLNN